MIKAIIIDDEKQSGELLEIKIKKIAADIEIFGLYTSSTKGLEAVEEESPDVVFLDIDMPKLDGISLAKAVRPENTEIIFTTAFDQYAIEAIRVQALDYLLKPVGEEELKQAIDILRNKLQQKQKAETSSSLQSLVQSLQALNAQYNKIAISANDGIIFIQVKDIVRVESLSNYSKIFLAGGRNIVACRTLKSLEDELRPYRFIRPHKSHLVNLEYVTKYTSEGSSGTLMLTDGSKIEVSRRKKADFFEAFEPKD